MTPYLRFLLSATLLYVLPATASAQLMLTTAAAEFESLAGTTALADFADAELGPSLGGISAAGVRITAMVADGQPARPMLVRQHAAGLADTTTGNRFLDTQAQTLLLSFAVDQRAFAFSAACADCAYADTANRWVIELYDEAGVRVGAIEQLAALQPKDSFVGVIAQRFRHAVVSRSDGGSWLLDDLRQSAADRVLLTTDAGEFEAIAGVTATHRFEDLALGSSTSLSSGGVQLQNLRADTAVGGMEVSDQLAGLTANFWFGKHAPGSRFIVVNDRSLKISFASDQLGFALAAACYACDPPKRPSQWIVELYDDSGVLVGFQQQVQAININGGFCGILSSKRFRHAILSRSGGGNWLIDDLRESTAKRSARAISRLH